VLPPARQERAITSPFPIRNTLLQLLPAEDISRLSAYLEAVDLPRDFVIATAGGSVEHVYFPSSGIGSIVAMSPEGNQVEAGMFGREGFSPVQAAIGLKISPYDIVMQAAGKGHRVALPDLVKAQEASPALSHFLACYTHSLAVQVAFTALSNARHTVDERLARWLLMAHDRVDGDELTLTHDYISLMLAVRRPSVTTSMHSLEGNGFIKNERAHIIIRNRATLEDFARDAYGRPEQEYRMILGDDAAFNVSYLSRPTDSSARAAN
jgi:CRP-like cAMP-binding protein